MKKNKLIAGLCILASGFMFASCDNTDKPQDSTNQVGDNIPSSAFKVKVVYPDGTAVTGVSVQWCSSTNCYDAIKVDDNGVAYTTLDAVINSSDDFNVHVNNLPSGYGYNPYSLVQNSSNHDNTITLIKLNNEERLSGTEESPAKVEVGYYSIKIMKDEMSYIYFTPTEAGEYVIESYSPSPSDLEIYFAGNDLENIKVTNTFSKDGGEEKNFKHTFTVDEDKVNTPFVFIMLEKGSTSTFTFSVSKK